MLETEERKRIIHVIGICDRVKELTDEIGKENFVTNRDYKRDCLCFNIINGRYVLEDLQIECPGKYDDLPFGDLLETSDMVEHHFPEADFNVIWNTLITVFEPIKEYLKKALKDN